MCNWKERTISTIEMANEMACATIHDIYENKEHSYIESDELDDVHHAMEIINTCVVTHEVLQTHTV